MPPRRRTTKATSSAAAPRKAPAKRPATKTAAAKRAPGRPRKLEIEPELMTSIADYVRKGAHPERAAVAAGISERTHYLWQAKGLEEREHLEDPKAKPRPTFAIFLRYVDELDKAAAEAEILFLETATKGGAAGTAALELLARRFRDRWGPKAIAPSSGSGKPSSVARTPLDQLEQRREERRASAGT